MRTAEEIRDWVEKKRWRNDFATIHQIEAETLDEVLEFIHSEPPCTHRRCITARTGDGQPHWFIVGCVIGCDPIKFCPDCGGELPEAEPHAKTSN